MEISQAVQASVFLVFLLLLSIGNTFGTQPACQYQEDFDWGDIASEFATERVPDIGSCCAACNANQRCQGFVFGIETGICYLKPAGKNGFVPLPGFISGMKTPHHGNGTWTCHQWTAEDKLHLAGGQTGQQVCEGMPFRQYRQGADFADYPGCGGCTCCAPVYDAAGCPHVDGYWPRHNKVMRGDEALLPQPSKPPSSNGNRAKLVAFGVSACDDDPNCAGFDFNTGEIRLRQYIALPNDMDTIESGNCSGTYVKARLHSMAGDTPVPPCTDGSVPPGYQLIQGVSFATDTADILSSLPQCARCSYISEMSQICSNNTSCLVISTRQGVLNRVAAQSQWTPYTETACRGLLVKTDGVGAAAGSALKSVLEANKAFHSVAFGDFVYPQTMDIRLRVMNNQQIGGTSGVSRVAQVLSNNTLPENIAIEVTVTIRHNAAFGRVAPLQELPILQNLFSLEISCDAHVGADIGFRALPQWLSDSTGPSIMPRLSRLAIRSCDVEGQLPSTLTTPQLLELDLFNNSLTGRLPELNPETAWGNVRRLNLSRNKWDRAQALPSSWFGAAAMAHGTAEHLQVDISHNKNGLVTGVSRNNLKQVCLNGHTSLLFTDATTASEQGFPLCGCSTLPFRSSMTTAEQACPAYSNSTATCSRHRCNCSDSGRLFLEGSVRASTKALEVFHFVITSSAKYATGKAYYDNSNDRTNNLCAIRGARPVLIAMGPWAFGIIVVAAVIYHVISSTSNTPDDSQPGGFGRYCANLVSSCVATCKPWCDWVATSWLGVVIYRIWTMSPMLISISDWGSDVVILGVYLSTGELLFFAMTLLAVLFSALASGCFALCHLGKDETKPWGAIAKNARWWLLLGFSPAACVYVGSVVLLPVKVLFGRALLWTVEMDPKLFGELLEVCLVPENVMMIVLQTLSLLKGNVLGAPQLVSVQLFLVSIVFSYSSVVIFGARVVMWPRKAFECFDSVLTNATQNPTPNPGTSNDIEIPAISASASPDCR